MRGGRELGRGLAIGVALLAGCASPPSNPGAPSEPDPCERSNRGVFRLNDELDRWVLEPLADGWTFVTPEFLRVALDRMFENLRFPLHLVSNLGQGQLTEAGVETGRFLLNSTVGVAGLFDPASAVGLGRHDEDVGQMFGRWGIGSGPYWVVPVIGPSGPRDFVGWVFDSALDPLNWASYWVPGLGAFARVNDRAIADPQFELIEDALDPYVFVRDAYLQRRAAQIENRDPEVEDEGAAGVSDELYEIEEELYDLEAADGEPKRDGGADEDETQGIRDAEDRGPAAD